MNPSENYILETSEPFRSILIQIKSVVEITIPEAQLLYKWRMPFFYINGKIPLVYLNQTKDYVDVGFFKAAFLKKHPEKLITENRKVMRSLRYFSLEEIDDKILIDLLKEAYEIKDKKFYS